VGITEKYDFPKGRMISPNIRAWDEAEIEEWFRSRPSGGTEPKGIAKIKHERRRKAADSTAEATA
jgi:hypothetical protein